MLAIDRVSGARRGRMTTGHGVVETPAFMPVGTQATVKTLLPQEVRATGAQIILANTYHLMLRPGLETLVAAGGLHRFMGWDGPILTDSGGFQIFSLAGNVRVREHGVTFRSHIDGSRRELTPESAVGLQLGWGSDIVMALDHLVGLPADIASVRDATERTHRWLARCVDAFADAGGEKRAALFGICQGGMDPKLRRESAAAIASAAVAGSAIGGLSVGEPKPVMAEMLEIVAEILPVEQTAVPDGRRFTGRPVDGRGARSRSLRLRSSDPIGPQRSSCSLRRDASISSSAVSPICTSHSTRSVTATPVPGSAPPISITCFAPAKFSDCDWLPSTISAFSRTRLRRSGKRSSRTRLRPPMRRSSLAIDRWSTHAEAKLL